MPEADSKMLGGITSCIKTHSHLWEVIVDQDVMLMKIFLNIGVWLIVLHAIAWKTERPRHECLAGYLFDKINSRNLLFCVVDDSFSSVFRSRQCW